MAVEQRAYSSPAKICSGLDENFAERFSINSNARRESLMMTIVEPMTVMELIGPRIVCKQHNMSLLDSTTYHIHP